MYSKFFTTNSVSNIIVPSHAIFISLTNSKSATYFHQEKNIIITVS